MSTGELVMTLISLVTVALAPVVVGLATGMRRGGGLITANVIAAIVAVWWAIYWAAISQPHHVKHTILFLVLAVVALIAASFSRPVRVI